jgi:hypothetical protein
MTTVIERIAGHYERQCMAYGWAYVWHPECVVVECECGKRSILSASESVCRCGTDHGALVRENTSVAGQGAVETPHPWEQEFREWREQLPEYVRSEQLYQRELAAIE